MAKKKSESPQATQKTSTTTPKQEPEYLIEFKDPVTQKMWQALKTKNAEMLQEALDEGANPNQRVPSMENMGSLEPGLIGFGLEAMHPFFFAIYTGFDEGAKILSHAKGINVNSACDSESNSLWTREQEAQSSAHENRFSGHRTHGTEPVYLHQHEKLTVNPPHPNSRRLEVRYYNSLHNQNQYTEAWSSPYPREKNILQIIAEKNDRELASAYARAFKPIITKEIRGNTEIETKNVPGALFNHFLAFFPHDAGQALAGFMERNPYTREEVGEYPLQLAIDNYASKGSSKILTYLLSDECADHASGHLALLKSFAEEPLERHLQFITIPSISAGLLNKRREQVRTMFRERIHALENRPPKPSPEHSRHVPMNEFLGVPNGLRELVKPDSTEAVDTYAGHLGRNDLAWDEVTATYWILHLRAQGKKPEQLSIPNSYLGRDDAKLEALIAEDPKAFQAAYDRTAKELHFPVPVLPEAPEIEKTKPKPRKRDGK